MEDSTHSRQAPLREGGDALMVPLQAVPEAQVRWTWVSWLATLACVLIFIGLTTRSDRDSWEVLSRFGFLPAERIWEGAWWGTLTSAFVHMDFLHAVFNLYWLWNLGRRLEGVIGSLPFLVFYAGAALVSSTSQLAVSDTTGIGASGVVYAIFGFMWRTRAAYPQFHRLVDRNTIQIFFVWLVACFFLTAADILSVGNAAHLSGLLFGVAAAECFVIRKRSVVLIAVMVVLVGAVVTPLWWCPWSVTWQGVKASQALQAYRLDEAMTRLNDIIERDPGNVWAYKSRGWVHLEMRAWDLAKADYKKAAELEQAPSQSRAGEK